jgi:hypothetical protein
MQCMQLAFLLQAGRCLLGSIACWEHTGVAAGAVHVSSLQCAATTPACLWVVFPAGAGAAHKDLSTAR